MKNHLFRKSLVIGIIILLFGAGFVVGNVPNNNYKTSEHFITIEQAQEMINAKTAILLDVQEPYISSYINGVIPVTLSDLECGSCTEEMLKDYKNLIVFSEDNTLRAQASQMLRDRDYIVYELNSAFYSEDFPLSHQIYNIGAMDNSANMPVEEHTPIQIAGTTARVSAYKRDGQIKRLYGEAFSQGESPEESAENFLQDNAHIFGVETSDLGDQYLQPIMYNRDTEEYKFTGVNYVQYKDDIPVFRSRLILLVRNEDGYPLVHSSVDLRDLSDFIPDTNPGNLKPGEGINNALMEFPSLVTFTQPELIIWAGINDMVVQPTLAFTFIGDNGYQNGDSSPEKYLFVADAETGELLYVENLIVFVDVTGNVKGKITQDWAADICDFEYSENLMWARVNIGTTIAYADEDGDFTISNSGSSPVTVESRLWGEWFKVNNQAGSSTVLSKTVTPPGPANFIQNSLNNDEYKRAEVNGYYQANIVRDFTLTYNPDYPGLQQTAFPVNVNLNDNCNAYYDYSSINFFTSGGGCPNTAYSTIVHHEYGHHLVSMAGSGQNEYGEGMGDVMGILITDDSGLAYGFFGDCDTPLRNADNDLQYPCSGEIHYCGQLLSGCVWDTRCELKDTNPSSYIDIISNLAINAMLLHTGSGIDPSITIDYLVLDDDNDNIYDGTPHYWEIAAGFGAHNMDAPDLVLIAFEFPNGLPELISPEGGTTTRANVYGVAGEPRPDTGILYIDDGSGWDEIPMTEVEPNSYDAVFPAGDCQNSVSYYFSAEATDGTTQYWPVDAPDEVFKTVFAYGIDVIISDDFENDLGWTVENSPSLTTGAWERGVPVGGGIRGDPPTDYDDSGQCYLTDNRAGDSDIDDGITWLISPTLDLSDYDNAQIDYALWYTNNFGNDPNNDLFLVYASNNNGADWELVDTIGPETSSGWKEYSFMIGDFITPTSQVKVRFEASDLNAGSVVEAGIDAFNIIVFDCESPPPIPDLTCEGDLTWNNVNAGETVTTTISIENIGDPDSLLDWEICECPLWGEWTFLPLSGDDLTPEDGKITVEVEVIVPNEPNEEFSGEVKLVNKEDGNDFDLMPVTITTPRNKLLMKTLFIRLLERFPNSFLILRQLLGLE